MAELNSSPEKTGGKSPRKRFATRVDLTAMVDLAFLLITFFMLTTSMNKPGAFGLAMPSEGGEGPVPASRTLTLCLGSNHQVVSYLGTTENPLSPPKAVSFNQDGVRKSIMEMKEAVLKNTGKSMILLIKPSDKSQYGDLVNSLDEVKINGVDIYAIVDITSKDIDMLKQKNVY
jgi:biopolymer transport protein ExbD